MYKLGRVEVGSTAKDAIARNPGSVTITKEQMKDTNSQNMPEAISFTPGVIYSPGAHNMRNEPRLIIRGYGVGHTGNAVGFFIDGIPIYSIYERATDWSQFSTGELSEIQISKGYTSPLYGPSTMGGAVNMVTSRPTKKLEINLGGGWVSPTGHRENIRIGGAYSRWYYQVSVANFMREYWNLPSGYKGNSLQPSGRRINSSYQNQHYALKLAYTPNATDEYVFNIMYQTGKKESPISADGGSKGLDKGVNYVDWPYYNTLTAYLMSKSRVNEALDIRARLYYISFINDFRSKGTYMPGGVIKPNPAPNNPDYSKLWDGNSSYNDYSIGGGLTFDMRPSRRDSLAIAINVKNDNHTRNDRGPDFKTQTLPKLHIDDITTSVGLEYAHKFQHGVRFIISGSYTNDTDLRVERRDIKTAHIYKEKKASLNGWSLQGLVDYAPNEVFDMYVSVGKKDNMPVLKTRYPEQRGHYVANDALKPESALGPEIGFNIDPLSNLHFKAAVYYSMLWNEFISHSEVDAHANKVIWETNAKRQTSRYGVELSMATAFYRDIFHLMFNYSFTKKSAIKIRNDYPENIFNFIARANPTKNIDLILTGQWQQAFYDDNAWSASKMPEDYFDISLRAAYRPPFMPGFEIAAGVHNLLDQNTWVTGPQYPLEGRNYYIEASYRY